MTVDALGRSIDAASLLCREALPASTIATSRDIGWTSVLVEHNRALASDEPFETLPTPDHTIVVMTRGEQEIEGLRGGIWRRSVYQPSTVGMTAGGETARLRRRLRGVGQSPEKVNLYVPQGIFREAAEHYRRAGQRLRDDPLRATAFRDPLIAATASSLLDAMAKGLPDLYAQAAAQWLATHLLARYGSGIDPAEEVRAPGALLDKRLLRVLDYMSAHLAEPLSLEDLAAEAGISKFHFARLFRAATGETPHGLLVRLRMNAARQMLANTDLAVAVIAARCGFARAAHFGAAFARRFGASPTAFREQAWR